MVGMNRKQFFGMVKIAFREWQVDNVNLRAGALAFFIILPLPPLLLVTTTVFVQLFGESQAIPQLIQEIRVVAGPVVADMFRDILESSTDLSFSLPAFALSIVFSIVGAIGAFAVLRDAMNFVWGVEKPNHQSITSRIRRNLAPFFEILPLATFVIAWTAITTLLSNYVSTRIEPIAGDLTGLILRIGQIVLSFGLATLLFAVIFRNVPDVKIRWRDVSLAAIVTAVVFTVSNVLFGLYVQAFSSTLIGVTGSLILLLLWVFLNCQFLLFGAEFSKAYTTSVGSRGQTTEQKANTK